MEIEKKATDAKIRLAPAGEVTLSNVGALQAALRECLVGGSPVLLDLERVTGIDLAGLQVLVASAYSFAARRQPLTILRGRCVEQAWVEAGFPCGEVSGWRRQS